MATDQIRERLKADEYDFLRSDPRLGNHIILLGLGGSYAYGTNTESSDLDIRGAMLPSARELLLNNFVEQIIDEATDTVIYSFAKIVKLLTEGNPNAVEILGLRECDYLHITSAGRLLLDNKRLFLSRRCINTFGGYANQQLRRLENKSARISDNDSHQKNLMKITRNILAQYPDAKINTYVDNNDEDEPQVYVDINLTRYPLRELNMILDNLKFAEQTHTKLGKRNTNAITHSKLSKHAMHLVRLYYMAIDILERKEIVTYREREHELLMKIRSGGFIQHNNTFAPEFFELVNDLEQRFDYAKKNTDLPQLPDMKAIDELTLEVYTTLLKDEFNNS